LKGERPDWPPHFANGSLLRETLPYGQTDSSQDKCRLLY
jgi:hypothetical protein